MADVTFRFNRAPTGELSGESLVEQTEQALSELGQESSQAEEKAEEAIRIANAASETADQAVATAGQAQSTANSALTTAQSAQTSATQAVQTAQSAQTTAQSAVQSAQNAESAATSAQTAAESAQTAAENAESNASDAASAAEGSANSASAAQTAAESAQTSADQSATIAAQAQSAAASSAQSAQDAKAAAQLLAEPNRYSAKTTSLTLSAGQTIDISDLDNQNVAIGNKIIDAVGNIFEIASIDTTLNQVTLVAADPSATPPITGFWQNPAALADLSNVPASKGILVESYRNGKSWYRVYSDGWCEQGGMREGDGNYAKATINLLKAFASADYCIYTGAGVYSSAFALTGNCSVSLATMCGASIDRNTITASSFETQSAYNVFWMACGYIS